MKRPYILFILLLTLLPGACTKEDLSDLKDVVYVRRAGADMPARIYGNGASGVFLIILHGGPGGSGLEYRTGGYSDQLEEKYAVVYWDQRGQGMSQGHYPSGRVNLRDMAEDVRALALVLKHKYGDDISLFLMGHSWGGMLGTAVITTGDYQHLFKGWIEVDGAHDMPELFRGGIEDMITIGRQQIAQGHDSAFWQDLVSWAGSVNTSEPDIETVTEQNARAGEAENMLTKWGVINEYEVTGKGMGVIFGNNPLTSAVAGSFTSGYLVNDQDLIHISLTDSLYKVTIPCLFMWGAYDMVVSNQLARPAFDGVSSAHKTLIVFDNSGHSPMMTEGDLFFQEVDEFIGKYK